MTPTNSWTPLDIDTPSAPSVALPGPDTHVVAFVAAFGVRDSGWSPRAALEIARGWGSEGARVVLFDVGLEEPSLHAAAGLDNLEGVSDALMFGTSFQRLAQPLSDGLFLATAGTAVPRAEALRAHPRWRDFMDGFREAGAVLVLYLPAGAPGSEDLLRRCDAVVVLADQSEVASVDVSSAGALLAAVGPAGAGETGVLEAAAPVEESVEAAQEPEVAAEVEPALEPEAAVEAEPELDAELVIPISDLAPDDVVATAGPTPDDVVATADPTPDDVVPITDLAPDETEPHFLESESFEPESVELEVDPLAPSDPLSLQSDAVGEAEAGPTDTGEEWPEPPSTTEDVPAAVDAPAVPEAPAPPDATPTLEEILAQDEGESSEVVVPTDPLGGGGLSAEQDGPGTEEEASSPESAAAASRTQEPGGSGGSGQFLLLVLLLVILAALIAGRLGYVDIPYITPTDGGGVETADAAVLQGMPGAEEASPAEAGGGVASDEPGVAGESAVASVADDAPSATEATSGESPVAAFVLALGSFRDLDAAWNRATLYNLQLPTVQFIVAPVEVDGQGWFRLLAGPAPDTAELASLRDELRQAQTGGDQDWIIREARLAYLVGSAPRFPLAERNVEILSELGIPAHILRYTNAEGTTVFRVYAGAYADSAEAAYLGRLLEENSIRNAPLTERRGTRPE